MAIINQEEFSLLWTEVVAVAMEFNLICTVLTNPAKIVLQPPTERWYKITIEPRIKIDGASPNNPGRNRFEFSLTVSGKKFGTVFLLPVQNSYLIANQKNMLERIQAKISLLLLVAQTQHRCTMPNHWRPTKLKVEYKGLDKRGRRIHNLVWSCTNGWCSQFKPLDPELQKLLLPKLSKKFIEERTFRVEQIKTKPRTN